MIDLEKVKLVVWDLDDTFWQGTLSEGEVVSDPRLVKLVRELAERGIVSSICSKNDFARAEKTLKALGVWEYFVFPSINWDPKGTRIAELVRTMALRPANVLFIDDDPGNLEEARFYSEGLMTALPLEVLPELCGRCRELGKDDRALRRLRQYQNLEKKSRAARQAASNTEFLRSCDIQISIQTDCMKELERITELIARSNQLNYTKKRSDEAQVRKLLADSAYDCAYISAKDRFGDYGIIGFYALHIKTRRLEHFLFSCRTMGMGIEQYLYGKLGYPELEAVGEVAIRLDRGSMPDWIHETNAEEAEKRDEAARDRLRILFKGPCDTESSLVFVEGQERFDREFTYVGASGRSVSTHNTTTHIVTALMTEPDILETYRDMIPFWEDGLFETAMFREPYDIVFLSLFADAVTGVYRNKKLGFRVAYGDWYIDLTDRANWEMYLDKRDVSQYMEQERLERFAEAFAYCGRPSPEEVVEHLRLIRERLDPRCLLVLSLPTAYPYVDRAEPRKNDRCLYNRRLGEAVRSAFERCGNVKLIDYTDYADHDGCFLDSNSHFSKEVYYDVAMKYIEVIQQWSGERLALKSKGFLRRTALKDSVKRRLTKLHWLVGLKRRLWRGIQARRK